MSDSIEKQLISSFAEAWGEQAPGLLGRASALGLLALREVNGDGVNAALAVAATWSSGFFAPCASGMPGVVICLFKNEDSASIEQMTKQAMDGLPSPGCRALVTAVLKGAVEQFAKNSGQSLGFGEVTHLELSGQEARLASIVGNKAWVGTFSLSLGDDGDTQALMLYAPNGSMNPLSAQAATATATAPSPPAASAQSQEASANAGAGGATPSGASRRQPRREEPTVRNLERLLGMELEVIVRFGTTMMPLRDVVRLGTGTLIELNRAVDEPVELLVNNRPLARGEVVVIDGYYGVRITEIGVISERSNALISPGA